MMKRLVFLLFIVGLLFCVSKPGIPESWGDDLYRWIEAQDGAKADTAAVNSLSDTLGTYLQSVDGDTISPEQVGTSTTSVARAYIDTFMVDGFAMIYSATYEVDTNYTSTDTTTAEPTDTVCLSGELFVQTYGEPFVSLDSDGLPVCTLSIVATRFVCDSGFTGVLGTDWGGCSPAVGDTMWLYLYNEDVGSAEVVDSGVCQFDGEGVYPICDSALVWTAAAHDTCIAVRYSIQQKLDIGFDWIYSTYDTSFDAAD